MTFSDRHCLIDIVEEPGHVQLFWSKDTSKSSSKPSKKRSKEKSNIKNDYADEVATAGILTLIVAGVWTVAKIAAIPYTGGLSLIVP